VNQLASVGLILLISLLAGHLVKFARIPEVTGYILAGLVLGPSMLGWIRQDNIQALEILSDVALGLIMFSIGSIFKFDRFRRISRDVFLITAVDAALVVVAVGGIMLLFHQGWRVSMLLGIIAVESAAASTLMVIREYDSAGPLTDTITGVLAVNNVLCLALFSFAIFAMHIAGPLLSPQTFTLRAFYRPVYSLIWQMVGSTALGYLVGALLSTWATRVIEHGETLILLIGSILFALGLATEFQLSTLLTSLAVGATAANFSKNSRRLADVQARTDPPFYAIFFVIAGANLHLAMLKTLGLVGLAYILARAVAKFTSTSLTRSHTSLPAEARKYLPYSLTAHAGLAIGLVLSLRTVLPEVSAQVSTIVLAAILVFEVAGPVGTRYALLKSHEARTQPEGSPDLLA
jgi:Kef-type K+ transport system membrane component KefB